MKTTKRIFTFFLVLILFLQNMPIVFAAESDSNKTSENINTAETQTSLTAENGMGQIISNLSEAESGDNNYPAGYTIFDVTFENNTASVNVNVSGECKLVVAIFDEESEEMLCSATKELSASVFNEEQREDIISIEMDIAEMPEHFLAKAFILDENNNALCKNYICRIYTTAYQVFIETTPDDFEGKEILIFDDNCDDFGVLVNGAIAASKSDTMTYTYSDGVYTFYNAIDEVKSLTADDIFYYQLSEEIGDFLLIKVKSVKVNGTTVEITEDEDIALGDAFQFVRIDAEADFSNVKLDEENLGSALTLQEDEEQVSPVSARAEIDESVEKTFSTKFNISDPNKEADDKEAWDNGFSVKGSLGYSVTASAKLYYDVRHGKDFYEVSTSLNHEISIEIAFSGKISYNKKHFAVPLGKVPIGGILVLDICAYPLVSAEAELSFSAVILGHNKVSLTDNNGLTNQNDVKWLFLDGDVDKKVVVTLGIGCKAEICPIVKGKGGKGSPKFVASADLNVSVGFRLTLEPSLIGVLVNKHHDCIFCLDGSSAIFVEGGASAELQIFSDKWKIEWDTTLISVSTSPVSCYFSISEKGAEFGFGTCPNISYEVTVVVYDENGNLVEDATVSTTTGYCDAEKDKKFDDTSMHTDENGEAVFYFAKGQHEVIAESSEFGTTGQQFEILSNKKKIYICMFGARYFNGHYYKEYTHTATWNDAASFCESKGGHLATITSDEENSFLASFVESGTCYIGGYEEDEGEWCWITGERFDYTNWDSVVHQEPNNYRKNQTFIAFHGLNNDPGHNKVGCWDDVLSFSEASGFICEWDSMPEFAHPEEVSAVSYILASEPPVESEIVIDGTTATHTNAFRGTEYVLAVVKDENAEVLISSGNLLYIDQKTADGNTVSFDFVIPEGITEYAVKIFGISHTHAPYNTKKENIIESTCTSSGNYDEVVYCVCGEELSRKNVTTDKLDHTEETIPGKSPTCKESGLTNGTKCSLCGEILVEQTVISPVTHIDENKDAQCDYGCGYKFGNNKFNTAVGEDDCNHICHNNGFLGILWKIINFFFWLFGIQQYCDCGFSHW